MANAAVTIPDSDQAIWLSYARGIRDQLAPGGFGPYDVLYVCPPTYVGLGVNGRAEDINRDVEKTAGAMLPATAGALFNPASATDRYCDRFRRVSNFIDPADDVLTISSEQEAEINSKRSDMEEAVQDYKNARAAAWKGYARYLNEKKEQNVTDPKKIQDYQSWLASGSNAPGLDNAEVGVQNATSTYHTLPKNIYGKTVQDLIDVQGYIAKGDDEKTRHPGFNMATVFADVPSDKKIDKDDISYVPAFSLSGYSDLLAGWKKNSGSASDYHTIQLSVKQGQSQSWASYGHEQGASSSGSKIWVVFNNVSEQNADDKKATEALESQLESVDFALNIKELAAVPIARGSWDHPSLRGNFHFLPGVPAVGTFVVPTTILVGYGVGLDASFGGDAKEQVKDSLAQFAESNEAGLNILGFQIHGSKSSASSASTARESVKFDSDKGRISISPEKNLIPVVLGILGSKTPL